MGRSCNYTKEEMHYTQSLADAQLAPLPRNSVKRKSIQSHIVEDEKFSLFIPADLKEFPALLKPEVID